MSVSNGYCCSCKWVTKGVVSSEPTEEMMRTMSTVQAIRSLDRAYCCKCLEEAKAPPPGFLKWAKTAACINYCCRCSRVNLEWRLLGNGERLCIYCHKELLELARSQLLNDCL